jgi:tRNA-splicing ligase RtcB (3'-phosphate/5'-hydroxy nucleic acid ligase)
MKFNRQQKRRKRGGDMSAPFSVPADPELFFGSGRRNDKPDYHTQALCKQVLRALTYILAGEVAGTTERLLGAGPRWETLVHCDHNHVELETHGGRELFVHRKGATLAAEGAAGIVPGSMAGPSFHTMGRGEARALRSSSHGAGRRLSRTQARERISVSQVRQQMEGVWYDHRLLGALREESPAAYKGIREVMAAQGELTKVVRVLMPVLCYKGG